MSKLRLLFIKEAQASYISHLDLLRTFQRAFPRTELDIKHSQGYHPHPIISIVLPLPVGQSSDCELLDFEVTQDTDGSGIAEKLNTGMPSGLRVLDCYPATRPVRDPEAYQAQGPCGCRYSAHDKGSFLYSRGGRCLRHCHGAGAESRPESAAAGEGCRPLSAGADAGLHPHPPPRAAGRGRRGISLKNGEKKLLNC